MPTDFSDMHRRQRAHYEGRADRFDQDDFFGPRANRCHFAKILRIHRWINPSAGDRILEVGVGTGIHASWFLEMAPGGIHYVGIDLALNMLLTARRRLGDSVALAEAAAERLPFGTGSFEGILCSGTLHHVTDRCRAIQEMARVTKLGGHIVLSEPNPLNPKNLCLWMTDPLERGQREMRPAKLRAWLEQAGLVVKHVEFFNFTPPVPKALSKPFDLIDSLCSRLPIARGIASMLLVVAEKPKD